MFSFSVFVAIERNPLRGIYRVVLLVVLLKDIPYGECFRFLFSVLLKDIPYGEFIGFIFLTFLLRDIPYGE